MEAMMTLTGYVGHNIELRQTRTGLSTVSFRIGTTPRIRTDNGWIDGVTTWINVVCYRALADHVAASLVKGDPVIVQGRVRTQAWTDPSGAQHEKMVVEAGVVGHDLNRGVSAFSRSSTRPSEGPSSEAVSVQTDAKLANDDEEATDDMFDGLVPDDVSEDELVGV